MGTETTDQPMVRHEDDYAWESRSGIETRDDVLKWKLLVDADRTASHGFSLGILQFPPNQTLLPHRHKPQEIYYIKSGAGRLRIGDSVQNVEPGTVVYIPQNCVHGIENIGTEPLLVMWIFPTDAWSEVEYLFEEE